MNTSLEVIKSLILVSTVEIKDIHSKKRNSPLDNQAHYHITIPF